MINLNPQQLNAANALEGAVMVLAGAGSGKTRVLTERIGNLVNSGVLPYNILAITFTNKAAAEMKERLIDTCSTRGMTICTIHSMCARILREDADKLGYTKNFTIYDATDSKRVIKKLFKRFFPNEETKSAEKYATEALSILSDVKNDGLTLPEGIDDGFLEYCSSVEIVEKLVTEYQKQLKLSDSMDFDDLLLNVYLLLRDNEEILAKYRQRYRYISIDEFQDTNTVQYKIFRLLAGDDGNIFVVGDDDQSIYGWRGANADNMQKFKNDYPSAQVFYLEQNYRSTKKILEVANNLIKKNDGRFDKTLWTENADGVRVENYSARDESDEARFCIQQVSALVGRGYKYSDFAILMRINALSRSFEQECMSYGIPFKVFGGFKFFERKEIKDVTAYLRLIVNPSDDEAFLRAIGTRKGIGDATINKLVDYAAKKRVSLTASLLTIEEDGIFNKGTAGKLSAFGDSVRCLSDRTDGDTVGQIVAAAVKISGLTDEIKTEEDRSRAENLNELCLSASEFAEANPEADLTDYLESISLKSDIDEMNSDDYLSIATIHAAKGLEWKVVFVVGMDEGIFPGNRAITDLSQMREERRLAYVAVTRARERLFVTRAQSRFLYGERKYMVVSRFYKDIVGEPQHEQRYDSDGVPTFDFTSTVSDVKTNSTMTFNPSNFGIAQKVSQTVKPSSDAVTSVKIGQKVLHKLYGEGIVLNLNNGNADILFNSVGKKTLNLKFAPLKILD